MDLDHFGRIRIRPNQHCTYIFTKHFWKVYTKLCYYIFCQIKLVFILKKSWYKGYLFRSYCHQDFVKKSDQVKTAQISKTLSETTAPMSKHQLSNLSTLSTANQKHKSNRFKKEKILKQNSCHCPFNKRKNYLKKFP